MSAPEIYGLPEIPEGPNVPIFPLREVDRWPHDGARNAHAPNARSKDADEKDRVELSDAARSFHSARVLFEDIVAGLRERMSELREPVVADPPVFDASLRSNAAEPLATANLMLNELQRIAQQTFGRAATVSTAAFERFREESRAAVDQAARSARQRLAGEGQFDVETDERLEVITTAVTDGIAGLTPR
jgi:hypothetical protein